MQEESESVVCERSGSSLLFVGIPTGERAAAGALPARYVPTYGEGKSEQASEPARFIFGLTYFNRACRASARHRSDKKRHSLRTRLINSQVSTVSTVSTCILSAPRGASQQIVIPPALRFPSSMLASLFLPIIIACSGFYHREDHRASSIVAYRCSLQSFLEIRCSSLELCFQISPCRQLTR
jgi:hypothetical protein